jgi:uncharacterized Zn-binding protein involved in type VI secretion
MMRFALIYRMLLVLSVATLAGCGEKNWATVSGTVTVNGTPIGPGTIMFEPSGSADARARSGIGNFKEDGKYSIRSAGGRDGIPAGEYRVLIDGKPAESSGDEQVDTTKLTRIPAKYLNPSTSDLNATLEAGDNTVNFDLKP